mmetsp:Transcript_117577/g.366252  ORF Transcript_117577/g.366252 Transcript_117577/m.366252 type:complete len:391 (+) Transcript_117577:362-1534(+)
MGQARPVGLDLAVGRGVVAGQRVLAAEVHACGLCVGEDLLHELLRAGAAAGALLLVPHLEASEVDGCAVRREDLLGELRVGVPVVRVVVTGRHLGGMGLVLEPPVDTRDLSRDANLPPHGLLGGGQHGLAVALQGGEVPIQEELPVVRGVAGLPEGGAVRPVIVAACVRGRRVPLGMAGGLGRSLEAGPCVGVPALEGADATELPVRHLVSRVTQLAGRAHADLELLNGAAHVPAERRRECAKPVRIHVEGRAALNGGVVREEGDVLLVLVPCLVLVPDVLLAPEEGWQRDVARVPDVAAALVERRDDLHLHAAVLGHLHELLCRPEVVRLRAPLRDAPPHVHHETVDVCLLHLVELPTEAGLVLQGTVTVDGVQGQHDIHVRGGGQHEA